MVLAVLINVNGVFHAYFLAIDSFMLCKTFEPYQVKLSLYSFLQRKSYNRNRDHYKKDLWTGEDHVKKD